MSFLLGLTGSIGMGKSTTAAMFAEAGVPVWDADAAVRRLYGQGGRAVAPIGQICPDAINEGAVDRAALKRWLAATPGGLTKLEGIVHPLVANDRAAFIRAHDEDDMVLLDIPLLYETGADAMVDAVLVVTASPGEQRARVMARGTMTEAEFETILAKQLPDAQKRARADYVIETTGLEAARAAVHDVIADIRGKLNA